MNQGKLVSPHTLRELGEKLRRERKKIVFTSGTFDLIHVGHARFLQKAKSLGDILVVGVPSNQAVRMFKGDGRPVVGEKARAEVLLYLEPVDFVTIFPEKTVAKTLEKLKPHIFFTVKEEWNINYKKSPEYKIVTSYGGKVVISPRQAPFISASEIIEKAAGIRVKKIFESCLKLVEEKKPFAEQESLF